MATDDISRRLLHPEHHYTGVRAQQSRPLLDSDVNEGELLDDEDRRRDVVDVVGPHGSTDEGFTVGKVKKPSYDFPIHAGSYWLGGLRFEISDLGTTPATPQRFQKQLNWLQQDRGGLISPIPAPPKSTPRQDLVYLAAWEQSVSAVEDPELLELALGGPDTTSRVRRMHRVLARAGTPGPTDCVDAFKALVAQLTSGGHSFDWKNHELLSGARLTVIPDKGTDGDLCKPALHDGYVGSENQAIRIHCSGPDRFLWGYDDTAPLYRIDIPADRDQDTVTITLLTPPRDSAHYPTVGQVLEILPWGAALANGEKAADHHISPTIGGGVYLRVVTSYDPNTRLLDARPFDKTKLDNMIVWLNLRAETNKYFYARVWNPGDDAPESGFGVQFKVGKPVSLVGTGLSVVFAKKAIPGDHWILAARPAEPTRVVPWDLLSGAAPHGPRRFYCPLAMIHWGADAATAVVHSCRTTFHPLTRRGRCCSVTVGDGQTSFGDYKTITDALRALPVDVPAKICVLPGVYNERVIIQNRRDLVIEGCGPRTILRRPAGNNTSKGLITITGCARVTLRDLKIEAVGLYGVMIFDAVEGPAFHAHDITLESLDITTYRDMVIAAPTLTQLWISPTSSPIPLSPIAAYLTDELSIRGCNLTMGPGISSAPCIALVACARVLIEGSQVIATTDAWGGIHIGPGCDHVVVERNRLSFGLGHGITLGGVVVGGSGTDHVHVFDPGGRTMLVSGTFGPSVTGCIPNVAPPPGGGGSLGVSNAAGVSHVEILENRIDNFGGSGISVLGFREYVATALGPYEMIEADDLLIADNRIYDNYNASVATAPAPGYLEVVAFGGIVLADADAPRVRDNIIRNNSGRISHAACGIYLLHGENVVVENNRILDNGLRIGTAMAGIRAGIALQMVGRRVTAPATTTSSLTVEVDHLLPAARVRGNFVSQPVGRALQLYGIGPMLVDSNVLVSQGFGVAFTVYDAHCVEIQNIGQSSELVEFGAIPADVAFIPAPPLMYDPGTLVEELLIDGRILFANNQVRFSPTTATEATAIGYAVRLQSYGDIGMFDNQLLVRFPAGGGSMMCDTTVSAWSTRVAGNRWVDPAEQIGVLYQTETSALTVAAMNITALNQATRCIIAEAATGSPTIDADNPIVLNQTYTPCAGDPEFGDLLDPPPL